MMAGQTIRYPCKCISTNPKHTIVDVGDGYTGFVSSSCSIIEFSWLIQGLRRKAITANILNRDFQPLPASFPGSHFIISYSVQYAQPA